MIKKLRIQIKLFFIISFILLNFSCKKNKDVILYEGFDFQKLEPILESKSNSNWYLKGAYLNNSLNSIVFLNKESNTVLRKDSIYYLNNSKYFVNRSKFKYKAINLEMFQITFNDGISIQRHFLVKKSKKYYLSAIAKQINSTKFDIKRINTNSFCLEFDNILEYLDNIVEFENEKIYFTDFCSIDIFYKNDKVFYKKKHHFDWGISESPSYSILKNNYGNLFLDLDNFETSDFLVDASTLNCFK